MSKLLLTSFICIFLFGSLFAQEPDTLYITDELTDGIIETTINGDTTATGERKNPNRVYVLNADGLYIQNARFSVENEGGTLTIMGAAGGMKPIIWREEVEGVAPGTSQIKGNLVMKNIHYQCKSTAGQLNWGNFNLNSLTASLVVEDCFFEFVNGWIFNMNNVTDGCNIKFSNNYFRDLFIKNQWWASRVIQCKVPIDTLIFENNTVSGGGLTFLAQESNTEYAMINHNTFINNHKYVFLNQYWLECYFTNNLFVNANWVGEDHENVATGGQDPDALLHGICGVDTITTNIKVQGRYLNADSTQLLPPVDDIANYKFYAADNIVVYSPEFDNYYGGGYNDTTAFPLSYLNWGGLGNGPWQVVNIPGIWKNERTTAMLNDWNNLVEENNYVYDASLTLADLGLSTTPLSAAGADVYARWDRVQWGVPGAQIPLDDEFLEVYFGDNDPLTVPGLDNGGVSSENGLGLTKISDVPENFSYSNSVKSQSDGYSIGALHWTNEIDSYDAEAAHAAIKAAYSAATAIASEPKAGPVVFRLEQNYPNPFNPTTTLNFTVPNAGKVTLEVFNLLGQKVATVVNGNLKAGSHTYQFDGSNLASGVYIYRINVDNKFNAAKKMMLLK